MKKIHFNQQNIQIAAHLYLPHDFNETQQYAAVICGHPVGGVKEQTAHIYAQKLAEQGFIALTFDAAYQGESGGKTRQLENPYQRVEDFRAAIDYLDSLAYVDENRIGILGICGAGGYVIHAAIIDHRIKAVVGVSAVNIGDLYRQGWYGDNQATASDQTAILDSIAQQLTVEAQGAAIALSPWSPESLEGVDDPEMREAYDYYRTTRAQHPNAPSQGTTTSTAVLMSYDAFHFADRYLTQPLLLVVGSEAGSAWHSQQLIKTAAAPQKELFVITAANHFDLYDRPDAVNEAVEKIVPFFQQSLSGQ
ncbi:alpha/beta hydrolase [Acinetobacter modestus]|uniref:alpha/beta hydrolase n=1 Tax=Acinetobacter modestus TaxID=1776740 RepID=UPI001F4B79A2|nr:alpha/beta hydrolase [Acinetobacter modestus]MCH7385815.1 alpha/beta hydrolase [Acinetobacter modestus]